MRILYLVHRSWPYHGGSERYVLEHALAAVRRGHEAVIATTDAWDMASFVSGGGRRLPRGRFVHRGVEILRFPVVNPPFQNLMRAVLRRVKPGGPDRYFYPNPFVPEMDRWLGSDHGFDLVHANAMPFLLYGGYRHAVRNGIPLVAVPHANLGTRDHRISPQHYFAGRQPEVLRSSDLVVAQNRFEASVYAGECGVKRERIMVHGSGIEPGEWAGASAERGLRTLSLPSGARMVLSVTAHCRDKGSMTLLDSAISLWESGMDFHLVMAGPLMDDFRKHLDSRSSEIPDGKLVVTGYISERLRKDIFTAARAVAAPSRLDAFGIVILDGWISGTPVIGCNAGGMPDLIDHGKDGFLVDFGDREALAGFMRTLLEKPELADSMGRTGRKKTMRNHTWGMVTDRFFHELQDRRIWKG